MGLGRINPQTWSTPYLCQKFRYVRRGLQLKAKVPIPRSDSHELCVVLQRHSRAVEEESTHHGRSDWQGRVMARDVDTSIIKASRNLSK